MKKLYASLMAMAIVSLGMGFTSCGDDNGQDPVDPDPVVKTAKFINRIAFNAEMVEICDITIELTGLDGKTTTTDIKDCPISSWMDKGNEIEYTVYVFEQTDSTTDLPAETSMKINYKYNGNLPTTGELPFWIIPGFKVSCDEVEKSDESARGGVIDELDLLNEWVEEYVKVFYSTYVMKVDEEGEPSIKTAEVTGAE